MFKSIDFKPVNGKLLRLKIKFQDKRINSVRIFGDFFIYPEESISLIELFFKNKKLQKENLMQLENELNELIKENKIQVIGFNAKDLINIIFNGLK